MQFPFEWLLWYALAINAVTFVMFGLDKSRARRKHGRISEAALLLASLAGGVLGGVVGMSIFRHKTRKIGFKAAIFLILVLYLMAYYLIMSENAWPSIL